MRVTRFAPYMILIGCSALTAPPAFGDDLPLAPFAAHYEADWKSISVGSSDLELRREGASYLYTWTITAHGIFRMVYRDALVQRSLLSLEDGHARPESYRAIDGAEHVDLDFDWRERRVHGSSQGKPVDFPLTPGTQDVMSIQVEVMLGLKSGHLSPRFTIIDKDEPKEFSYSDEGAARLHTAIGTFDTVVVASRRVGNNRILRMWFAPALGYIPVQAERSRDGKLEFAMRITGLKR